MKFCGRQKDDEQDRDDEWGMNVHFIIELRTVVTSSI